MAVNKYLLCCVLCATILAGAICDDADEKRSNTDEIPCLEVGRFYRNPSRQAHRLWTSGECAKYFLCLEGEVFEFRCSEGLLFDVIRQICDFQANVDNCDITAEERAPKPLLDAADCEVPGEKGCADGTCLPGEYFCDGALDCPDGSDEAYCNEMNELHAAPLCNPSKCRLPSCYCTADKIPGGLHPAETPQIIYITLTGPVAGDEDYDLLRYGLLPENVIRNPNGCPAKATLFVTHRDTDYAALQKIWNDRHEIAVNSITHRGPSEWWSRNASVEDWFDEMVGSANIVNKFGSVRAEELLGVRAPFLSPGSDRQFLMMQEFGFEYDATLMTPVSAGSGVLWPYTLDYRIPHRCVGDTKSCPTRSYPGLWELVINPLTPSNGEPACPILDPSASCATQVTGDDSFKAFSRAFVKHYKSNRAPLGLHFRSSWFKTRTNLEAFQRFLSEAIRYPDVYIMTAHQVIEWIKNPTPLSRLRNFEPWGCTKKMLRADEKPCKTPRTCKLFSRLLQQNRYLRTCKQCPAQYPWIRNEFGID